MRLRHCFVAVLAVLLLIGGVAGASPSYRSFIEWNGPYYHVRHALNADSSAYLNYLVNNPLPLYGSPFSSPTAVVMYGSVVSPTAFVVDHDHRRVQVFNVNANWKVEALAYSATQLRGTDDQVQLRSGSAGQRADSGERSSIYAGEFVDGLHAGRFGVRHRL
jgi:hypothetical protein